MSLTGSSSRVRALQIGPLTRGLLIWPWWEWTSLSRPPGESLIAKSIFTKADRVPKALLEGARDDIAEEDVPTDGGSTCTPDRPRPHLPRLISLGCRYGVAHGLPIRDSTRQIRGARYQRVLNDHGLDVDELRPAELHSSRNQDSPTSR